MAAMSGHVFRTCRCTRRALLAAAGLLLLRGRQALPEEAVVPQLGSIVEELVVAFLFRTLDDLDQRSACTLRGEQLVGLVDIGLVMLAVMVIERLGRHVRRQCILGERQVGKREGHMLLRR